MRYGSRLELRIEDDLKEAIAERMELEERKEPDVVRRILRAALIPVVIPADIHERLAQAYEEGPDGQSKQADEGNQDA